jgi:hypothetical protein
VSRRGWPIEVFMSSILACPFCGRKLRVSDELRGQMVRCPACNETFDSTREPDPPPPAPASESPPVPQDLPLQLAIDEPSSEPKPAPGGTPGLVGAIELKLSLDDGDPSRPPAPPWSRRHRPNRWRRLGGSRRAWPTNTMKTCRPFGGAGRAAIANRIAGRWCWSWASSAWFV